MKGLKNINFAYPIPNDSWVQQLVPPEELNALALEVFARFKIPIKATPLRPTMIGQYRAYTLPAAPSLAFNISTRIGSFKTADLKLELRDEVELKNRPLDRKLIVTICETELSDPGEDKESLRAAFTQMAERFCLSFLSANRGQ